MKNILVAITIFLTSLLMSCSEDFINLDPISSVSVDRLYQTDKDFQDALTAVYNAFQSQYQNFYIFGDVRADDFWQEIYKGNSWSFSDTFATTSSDGLMNSTWQNYYTAIFRINTILLKIADIDNSVVPNKERYIAEAKFLRALAYFDLVRIFGDVPMVTTPLTIEEGYTTGRTDLNVIYDQLIIPDLQAAENGLPANYSASDIGRPTKGAAKAILGRVYMTLNRFELAEAKLLEVTTMGYELLADFNDVFDYSNEHHKEYIFDIEYEEGMGEGSLFTNRFLPNFNAMATFYGVGGYGDEQMSPTQAYISLFSDDDARKDITVGVTGGFYDNEGTFFRIPTNTSQTYTKKYLTPVAAANDSKATWKVIRYADVILMYAEALNENDKTDLAIPYLNQVRTRSGLEGYPLDMTQSETRDAIVLERRLEFGAEGLRWFDLLRTGQAFNVMKDFDMLEYMTVFPLPLSQIQLINDPAIFPQNPGYE